ncbi:MAG: hypothetical protein KH347_03350 [Acetobacter sp.]|nr:hypothetical protein [Acetobacter sp.]
MSNSVSEFFSKEGIKKFKNGAKAFAERQAVKVAAVSMVLAGAFASNVRAHTDQTQESGQVTAYAITEKGDTICSYLAERTDSASFARLQGLVNNATKSKTGCEILKNISKQNTLLSMGDAGSNTIGYFAPDENVIVLNDCFDNPTLQSCLVHEGKHSVQSFALGNSVNSSNTFYTNTLISRVMEADAVATQTKFSYEMAQAGDSAAWKSLQEEHKGITDTFEAGAKKYGQNKKKTMRETMLAWYKDKAYAGLYDQSLVQFHTNFALKSSDDQIKDSFKESINTDELIRAVCRLDGKTYAKDGDLLTTPETAYLSRSDHFGMQVANGVLKARTGREDVSASFMYPVEKDGTVSKLTYVQEDQVEARQEKQEKQTKMAVNILKLNMKVR